MDARVNLLKRKIDDRVLYGMDASSANKTIRTGVENYARHLLQAMKPRALQGDSLGTQWLQENERVLLYSPNALDDVLDSQTTNWQSAVLKWPLAKGWMSGRVSWEMLRRAPDVLFVPSQGLPWFVPKHTVTTIHDIGFVRMPGLYDTKVRRKLVHKTKRALRAAERLIVPSVFTKQELMEVYRVPEAEIIVTPLAADTTIYRPIPPEQVFPILQRHRVGTNFFLFVGRLEKKKNVTTLIRAFELFKQDRGLGDPFELVLVGDFGFGENEIKKYIEFSKVKASIRLLGYREDEEVAALMNAAIACVFPSWYEGFGLPNLEAMACDTPLLTADIPPHREVCGDAAMFVSPKEPEAWAHAMRQIVKEGSLRDSLVEKGRERVKAFSWEKTAAQTWEVLRSLV